MTDSHFAEIDAPQGPEREAVQRMLDFAAVLVGHFPILGAGSFEWHCRCGEWSGGYDYDWALHVAATLPQTRVIPPGVSDG